MELTKRDKRNAKKQQKQNEKIVVQICQSGGFHDCTPLVLEKGRFCDEDLNQMYMVSKFWHEIIWKLYKRIKKVEYIFTSYESQDKYVLYGFMGDIVYDTQEKTRARDIVELYTNQHYTKYECRMISVWSQSMFSTEALRSWILATKCPHCGSISYIDGISHRTECFDCREDIVVRKEYAEPTACKLWALANTANLK